MRKPRLQSIPFSGLPVIVAVLILTGSLIGGCGKKGPPVPPQRYRPAAVTDLSYELTDGRVEIHWTIPGYIDQERTRIIGCTVYRANRALADADCIDCRLSFQSAGYVAAQKDASSQTRQQRLRFGDNLTPGFEYAYRVVCSTAAGVSGKESNIVRFEYPETTTQ